MSHLTENSKISFVVLAFLLTSVVGSVWVIAAMDAKVQSHEEALKNLPGKMGRMEGKINILLRLNGVKVDDEE